MVLHDPRHSGSDTRKQWWQEQPCGRRSDVGAQLGWITDPSLPAFHLYQEQRPYFPWDFQTREADDAIINGPKQKKELSIKSQHTGFATLAIDTYFTFTNND